MGTSEYTDFWHPLLLKYQKILWNAKNPPSNGDFLLPSSQVSLSSDDGGLLRLAAPLAHLLPTLLSPLVMVAPQ